MTAFEVTVITIPSFIMTLAMLQIGAGICAMLVRGRIAYAVPDTVRKDDAELKLDRCSSRPWSSLPPCTIGTPCIGSMLKR